MENVFQETRPHILFFGMDCHFSSPVLAALLAHNIEVGAIFLPAKFSKSNGPALQLCPRSVKPRSMLPLFQKALPYSVGNLAHRHAIDLWDIYRLSAPETIQVLTSYKPDLICVACFSHRIPPAILTIPRLGCLNVHPSLLPRHRGPEPLFWALREGLTITGVTIHRLSEELDCGDIFAQETIAIPEGIGYTRLEQDCAERGGALLAQTIWNLFHGLASSFPQDDTLSSYQSKPQASDLIIPADDWDARHVYNFISAISEWQSPLTVQTSMRSYLIKDAISYSLEEMSHCKDDIQTGEGQQVIFCRQGWVRVVV